jgi:bifunctional enzyme CysN/CysC
MDASMDYCRKNKPELYEKAEQNLIKHIPGVDEIYEKPEFSDLVLNPEDQSNITTIFTYLEAEGIFPLQSE